MNAIHLVGIREESDIQERLKSRDDLKQSYGSHCIKGGLMIEHRRSLPLRVVLTSRCCVGVVLYILCPWQCGLPVAEWRPQSCISARAAQSAALWTPQGRRGRAPTCRWRPAASPGSPPPGTSRERAPGGREETHLSHGKEEWQRSWRRRSVRFAWKKTHYLDLAHSEEMYIISVISFKSRLKTHFYILAFTWCGLCTKKKKRRISILFPCMNS